MKEIYFRKICDGFYKKELNKYVNFSLTFGGFYSSKLWFPVLSTANTI